MTTAVAIHRAGMVTPVGFSAAATCAALRGAVDAFRETRFRFADDWLPGAQVHLPDGRRGPEKFLSMVAAAVRECLADVPTARLREVPVFLAVAETDRPGRPPVDAVTPQAVGDLLGVRFAPASVVIPGGRFAGLVAIDMAARAVAGGAAAAVAAGVDSLLTADALAAFDDARRLKTELNSNGFIPGEAAAAISLTPATATGLRLAGLGVASEPAPILSEKPLRADGLAAAITRALTAAGATWADIDYRIADVSGEHYGFKEAALAMTRTMRVRKAEMDLWHPADCIGETGAAVVPAMLGMALAAHAGGYAPGPGVLCHCAADGPDRGALVLQGPRGRG